MGNPRTDYMPVEEFKQRARWEIQQGLNVKPIGEPLAINVPWDADYDKFVANVAYALRTRMTYRRDGGNFARGIVHASTMLQKIHKQYLATPPARGTPVALLAMLYRRKTSRWMMSVDFRVPSSNKGDEIVITATPPAVTPVSEKDLMDMVIHYAVLVTENLTGDPGERMRGMVQIADRLGYPRNRDLWYYSRRAVFLYIRWEAGQPGEDTNPNSKRRRMTMATNGRPPFDGDTGQPEYVDWRIYPFRNAAKACRGKDPDACEAQIGNELIHAESEMLDTFADIDKEITRVSMVPQSLNPFKTTVPAAALGPLAVTFLTDLNRLKGDRDSLYSVF